MTTNFQIDPNGLGNVVATFRGTGAYNNSGGLLAHYTYGLGLVNQVSVSGAAGYYDFGLTGNTIGITNGAGSYVNKYSYLPFGQTTVLTAALSNPFTFVGQFGVMNDGGGTSNMQTRNYDPSTGHFLSLDPLGIAAGTNFYAYVNNAPVDGIDPTGFQAVAHPHFAVTGTTYEHWGPNSSYASTRFDPISHTAAITINLDAPYAAKELIAHEQGHVEYANRFGFPATDAQINTSEMFALVRVPRPLASTRTTAISSMS